MAGKELTTCVHTHTHTHTHVCMRECLFHYISEELA